MMVEEQAGTVASEGPPPPVRRPRVREVSSRFMSPLNSSSSSDHKQQRSSSVQKQRRQLEFEPFTCADDNIPNFSETPKISTSSSSSSSTQKKHHHHRQRAPLTKHFKENGEPSKTQTQQMSVSVSGRYSRPDTPNPMLTSMDRMVPSRFRLTPMQMPIQRPPNVNATPAPTSAAKLLQSTGLSLSKLNTAQEANTDTSLPHLRSSMPEPDMLPTVSNRLNNAIVADSSKFAASPCSRSLNLPLSKPYTNSVKMGGLSLPPVPPFAKLGTDARKGRKVSSHQEDVHSLRMLHNHFLQWRHANAKAEASMQAQKRETERTLYSLGVKMSDLYDSVRRKRIELGLLQRGKTLTTIIEAQMPYLDEWSALEGDYSLSMSEAIQALLNASIQLPVSGNIRADLREVGEALICATKLMEAIVLHVQSFMPKAEEMEILISELARVTGGERALIEECGDLLSRTYTSQVEECSLRGQLIQLHQSCPGQFQEDEQ